MNLAIWNAQGIANPGTQRHLKNLIAHHFLSFVAVIDPQSAPSPVFHGRRFGLVFRASNVNGKIWLFSHKDFQIDVVDDSEQVLHVRVTAAVLSRPIFVSVIYAKCTREARQFLWDKLRDISVGVDGQPWLVGGDFNIFLSEEERHGSSVDRHGEISDFSDAIADCQLCDPGFDGSIFTWERGGFGNDWIASSLGKIGRRFSL